MINDLSTSYGEIRLVRIYNHGTLHDRLWDCKLCARERSVAEVQVDHHQGSVWSCQASQIERHIYGDEGTSTKGTPGELEEIHVQ